MRVALATGADAADWLRLRLALWPHAEPESPDEIAQIIESPDLSAFIARDAGGFVVGFLEGIFVLPEARGQGVARALVDAAADWVRSKGCTEFASDADIDNDASHHMHQALGFEETQRVVYFRKVL